MNERERKATVPLGTVIENYGKEFDATFDAAAHAKSLLKETRSRLYDAVNDIPPAGLEAGRKNDVGKPNWALMPLKALEPVVRVLEIGAAKYSADNWKTVPNARERYFAAALRHLAAWQAGEKTDPESGINHVAHACCSLLFVLAKE